MGSSVLLTVGDVFALKDKRQEIIVAITSLNKELRLVEEKLKAAALFMAHDTDDSFYNDTSETLTRQKSNIENHYRVLVGGKPVPLKGDNDLSLVDAVIQVLKPAGKPLTNAEIKIQLNGTGYDASRLKESPYYYTVMKRLVDKGALEKLSNGSYMFKNDETSEDDLLRRNTSEASIPSDPTNRETLPSSSVKPWAGGGT